MEKSAKGTELKAKIAKTTSKVAWLKGAAVTVESYGAHQVGGEVVFTTLAPHVSGVQVAGEFNDWKPQHGQMRKISDEGVWQLKMHLAPGTYRYRLVIDGKWQQDPCNHNYELNPYGESNSVVTVS